ncbi:MAG: hypothetical protein IPL87_04435 [Candidatus Moraniibacteriota bacterium]|nr:MAG: hypothetical protein IPL87_04435 [Candidatus Moranbacteria bacterium]
MNISFISRKAWKQNIFLGALALVFGVGFALLSPESAQAATGKWRVSAPGGSCSASANPLLTCPSTGTYCKNSGRERQCGACQQDGRFRGVAHCEPCAECGEWVRQGNRECGPGTPYDPNYRQNCPAPGSVCSEGLTVTCNCERKGQNEWRKNVYRCMERSVEDPPSGPGTPPPGGCTPSNNCASNTCIGQQCWNGCNNVEGAKNCGGGPTNGACGTAHGQVMPTQRGPEVDGFTLCSSGTASGHAGTEPGGNPFALFTGGEWSGWDWDCSGGAEVIASPVVPALLLVETLVCAELLHHHRYKMEASPFLQRVPKGDRQEDTPLRYLLIRQPILCGLLQTFRVAMP